MPAYEPKPCYEPVGGAVVAGWAAAVAELPEAPFVLAVDGPALLDWDGVSGEVVRAVRGRGVAVSTVDMRERLRPWPDVVALTASPRLVDDPDFDRLADGSLGQLFRDLPAAEAPDAGLLMIFGPGAALARHDHLWYVDRPKRFAEADVAAGRGHNLGQRDRDGAPTSKRLFYIDWPLLDRHRDAIAPGIDRWIDVQDPDRPTSIERAALRATPRALARRPFRTQPTFNTTPWGGHWAQRTLGFNPDAPNTALGYELIAPRVGRADRHGGPAPVEVPFQLLVALQPDAILGTAVHAVFGTSFPIRFDYLDTVGGGNLSVHCHPRPDYMAEVFGWPYPQHETYYLMVGRPENQVFLGLREGVDVDGVPPRGARGARRTVCRSTSSSTCRSFAAEPHRLFCVPAGTPHGSGVGNVVLEVSATPYLYSLRFYDWLRRDAVGAQRPVHVEHAFANLNTARTGCRGSGRPGAGAATAARRRRLARGAARGASRDVLRGAAHGAGAGDGRGGRHSWSFPCAQRGGG